MSKVMPKISATYVEWVDSSACKGWNAFDRIELAPKVCYSIGFVVGENKSVLTIAGHVTDQPDQCSGDITIPKVAIVKRKRIRY